MGPTWVLSAPDGLHVVLMNLAIRDPDLLNSHTAYLKFYNWTECGWDNMALISKTTYSNAFSWIKMFIFWSNITEICSQGSNQQYTSIGSDNGLAPNRRQAIISNNADPVCWRIYVSLGPNELIPLSKVTWKSCYLLCRPVRAEAYGIMAHSPPYEAVITCWCGEYMCRKYGSSNSLYYYRKYEDYVYGNR